MRNPEFYQLCTDRPNSKITTCYEYGKEGCPMICGLARERRRLEGKTEERFKHQDNFDVAKVGA